MDRLKTARAGSVVVFPLIIGITLGLAACTKDTVTSAEGQAPATYVGRAACASCHQPEHARWQGSHHDLAMQDATDETILGDFNDATLTHAGVTSTFSQRQDTFFVRTDGPDGQLQEYEIAYIPGKQTR